MHMQTVKLFIKFSVCLGLLLLNVIASRAGEGKSWSADLSRYGMSRTRVEARQHTHTYDPKVTAASARGVVAVAFGMPRASSLEAGGQSWDVPWDISLLLFDVANGKLLAKAGPWVGDFLFDIFATPQGNFLLHVRQNHTINQKYEETLYLLSPSGSELRKLQVQPAPQRVKGSGLHLVHSPSGATLLLGDPWEDSMRYRVLDTDTLESRFEWVEPWDSDPPYVEAISDREMLGGRGKEKTAEIPFVRTFGSDWEKLRNWGPQSRATVEGSVINPHLLFLSEELLLGWELGTKKSDATVRIARKDGAAILSPTLPKPSHEISFPNSLILSQDGRYFAFTGTHENWGSHVMLDLMKTDMTFWPDEEFLTVWEASRAEPLAKFTLGKLYTPFSIQGICFAGDDPPGIAFVDGTTLKFVPLPRSSNSAPPQLP